MRKPVAAVTGGSRGIGAACCRHLARAGYHVAVMFHRDQTAAKGVVADIEADGGTARAYCVDVTSQAHVNATVEALDADSDGIDVLVNNAGMTRDALLLTTTLADWNDVLTTNITGAFLMCRAVVPLMLDRRGGTIVNVSSSSAHRADAGQIAYAASKGALEAMTRALAAELGHKNIRVNAVAPARVRTDMTAPVAARWGPDGTWAEPDDIADIVCFLASPASRQMNGQVLLADAGAAVTRRNQ